MKRGDIRTYLRTYLTISSFSLTTQQDAPDAVPLSLGLEDFAKSVACMILAGPLLTGFTQVSA